ncbi:CHAT domain-containing protein [Leptolyngbyaceae cyanobacterium UHCC 1019]
MIKEKWLRFRKRFTFVGQVISGCCLVVIIGLAPLQAIAPIHNPSAADSPTQPRGFTLAATNPAEAVQQGRSLYQAGRFLDAIAPWQAAAKTYQAEGDRLNQALTLSYLSLAYQKLGRFPEAKTAIYTSLDLLQQPEANSHNQLQILAQALNTQGSLELSQGNAEQALTIWQQATTAYGKAGDEAGRVGSLINQAQAQQSLGLYLRARKTLTEVSAALEPQTDPQIQVTGLRSLGNILRSIGDLETSQAVLEKAGAIARQANLPEDSASSVLSLGNTQRAQNNTAAALQAYQTVIFQSSSATTKAQAHLSQLTLLVDDRQWSQAITQVPEVQSQIAALPLSHTTIYAQINLIQTLIRLKQSPIQGTPDWTELAAIAAKAVQSARTLADQSAESYAVGTLGKLYEKTQQWGDAEQLTRQALTIAQAVDAPDIAYQWQWQLGRLLNAKGKKDGAIAAYQETIKTLALLRKDLVAINSDVQFSFRESVEPIYRQLVGLLLEPTLNTNNSQRTAPTQTRLKQAREVIESLQLAELDNFFQEACLTAQTAQIDRVDAQAAVIYSIILADRLEIILSLPNQPLKHYATAIPQPEMEQLLDKMRRSLRRTFPNPERLQTAQQVYNLLIQPAEKQLATSGVKTLVFVLDGSLQTIPMNLLYDGNQYLVEKYSVALVPGLQLLQPQPLVRDKLKVLVGALSEASHGFSALPGVEFEIEQIATKVPSQVLLNQDFTGGKLQTQIQASAFPVVHLATHGQFSSNAKDTFLLAWDSPINVKELDGLLKTTAESRDRNPIELLVLSACETASGDKRATLGLAGIAIRSGARSTLATLWAVDDESTAQFMVQFYKELNQPNVSKAEALRRAQLALLKQPEFRHPYYWAPFVLVGNWL